MIAGFHFVRVLCDCFKSRRRLEAQRHQCGFDERTIADVLARRTIEMPRHYAKGANFTIKMRDVAKNSSTR